MTTTPSPTAVLHAVQAIASGPDAKVQASSGVISGQDNPSPPLHLQNDSADEESSSVQASVALSHSTLSSDQLTERDLDERLAAGQLMGRLPVEIGVTIPIREFRVKDLLALDAGQVIASSWSADEDLPIAAGHVQLAWTEFEVVDHKLAVRVTRLA